MKKVIIATAILGTGAFFAHHFYLTDKVESTIEQYITKFNENGKVTLKHGDYGLNFKKEIYIKDVQIIEPSTKEPLNLGEILITDLDLKNETPYFMAVELNNISYDIKELERTEEELYTIFKDFAVDGKISTSLSFNYKYAPEYNNDFKFSLGQGINGVASTNLSFNIDNLDLLALEKNKSEYQKTPMAAMSELAKLQLKNISFDFNNEKLFQSLLRTIQQQDLNHFKTEKDVEDFMIEELKKDKERNQKVAAIYYDEAIKFIKDKKGLSLTVNPEPMPIMQLFEKVQMSVMQNPEEKIEVLNLELKSK